ncbi:hypothetical protein RB195_003305 [Necator americanus]|uniref:Uncharacterized protein n=1 Tax=Necator americanus TaxID=51031 RepID=A0ABR1DNJ9_NECAM
MVMDGICGMDRTDRVVAFEGKRDSWKENYRRNFEEKKKKKEKERKKKEKKKKKKKEEEGRRRRRRSTKPKAEAQLTCLLQL